MKSQPVTQQKTENTAIPDWLTNASQGAVTAGQNLPLYQPYTGQGVAPLTANQLQALGLASGTAGQGQGVASGAAPAFNGAMGFSANPVTSGSLNSTISGLLNPQSPYLQNVISAANNQLDKNTAQATSATDVNLGGQHAFGGDRQAIADADVANQGAMTKASTDSGLLNNAYQQAQQTALAAGQGNQDAAIRGAGVNLAGANGLTNLGTTLSGLNTGDLNNLLGTGGVAQNTAQNQNTFNYNEFLKQFLSPTQNLQTQAGVLGALPHDTTTNGTSTQNVYSNGLLGAAGLGLGLAGLGTGGGMTLGGSLLGSLFKPSTAA